MRHSPQQAALILDRARGLLEEARPDDFKLHYLWNTLAYIHATALAKKLVTMIGANVRAGPFKGMELTPEAQVGDFAPALLGIYEHELHPFIEEAIAARYATILNIGCAYGYYSVGLACRMPEVAVHAFDIDEACQKKCRAMAALNGVENRVTVGGEFKGEDFAAYATQKTLAIVDIEGAEMELLDPVRYPGLAKIDLIVELHDVFNPVVSRTIAERFAATHDVKIIRNRAQLYEFAGLATDEMYIDPFDRLLVTWENRDGPTPWAVMKRKIR
jgi:hypothetical protein